MRAAAALTAFTNALAISLFALIPDVGISWVAFSFGIVGVLFIGGSLLSLRRERQAHRAALRDATFLIGQLVVFALQIRYALRLVANGHDTGAAHAIATARGRVLPTRHLPLLGARRRALVQLLRRVVQAVQGPG